ncbi:aspartate/glutamate racemase family protein [Vagococcus silagei]|uniref:Amino acid racemase n=1 Tax=Vagococcus silagei TaxID=2508885 RepID=A0A4S3B7H4_9ENTE|nr:amino acid racemase [Vagococcus silagei]THB61843.1 amino acid racemase [Vagococcus silagei]
MKSFFTVIGGMGTMATELYVKMVNQKTPATSDQEYLDYILVNYSTIPDRSSYIMDPTKPNPLPCLQEVLTQQSQLEPDFFTLTCNTAHYFYQELVKTTDIPILHMPALAAESIQAAPSTRVGIIGTEGTIRNKIYDPFVEEAGYTVVHPSLEIQQKVSILIFDKIKASNDLDQALYYEILDEMFTDFNCDVLLLGCTELSLCEDATPYPHGKVIDPQEVLAERTVELALKNRQAKA